MKKIALAILLLLSLSSPAFCVNWCEDANNQGCWLFTEGSGTTVADNSANTNTGNFVSSGHPAWYNTSLPKEYMTWGVDFTPNDIINCGSDSTLDDKNTATWITWINLDSTTGENDFLGKTNTEDYEKEFYVSGGKLGFYNKGNSGLTYAQREGNVTDVSAGTWYSVAVVLTTSTPYLNIYKNGVEITYSVSQHDSGSTSETEAAASFTIGGRGYPSYINGKMAETAFFDTNLDSTDINDIMDNGLVQTTSTRRFIIIN